MPKSDHVPNKFFTKTDRKLGKPQTGSATTWTALKTRRKEMTWNPPVMINLTLIFYPLCIITESIAFKILTILYENAIRVYCWINNMSICKNGTTTGRSDSTVCIYCIYITYIGFQTVTGFYIHFVAPFELLLRTHLPVWGEICQNKASMCFSKKHEQ